MSKFIGCHITKKYGILNGLKALIEIGGNACQIQLKDTNVNYIETHTKIDEDEIKKIKEFVKKKNIYLINHSIHKINLARNPTENIKALQSLSDDIKLISKMGGVGSVVHMGKKLNLNYDDAIENMVNSLKYVINMLDNKDGYILLENSAGEGTALYTIEDIGIVYNKLTDIEKSKVKFVIDSCHSFAAGYELNNKKNLKKFIELLENNLGINNISCIHLNDSYENLSSRKDRHQNLLLGYLSGKDSSYKNFCEFLTFGFNNNIPFILETDPCLHIAEIQLLKNMI
jgi:apurinic endonuclease APN1